MTGTRATDTHCPYCALQCAQRLTVGADGAVEPAGRAFPTSKGGMCQKGWTSPALLRAPDRLVEPLVRGADGVLAPASWDDALDLVADRLAALRREHGADGVAVFGGGGLTNEKAYVLGKLARVALGTAMVDYNGRFCMSSAAAATNRSLGLDRGLPFPLADLAGADAILLLGSNLAETSPPAVAHLTGVRRRGGLVVADPRHSATAALADDGAGIHLQPLPGTDLVVLLALAHVVLADRLLDERYVTERTSGLDALRSAVAPWWPERAEQVCGVPARTLRRTAHLLAAASPHRGGAGAYVLTGRGVEQSRQGTDTVSAAIALSLLLGLVGRVGSGYGAITGQGNGQGGREHGQKCDQLPGYRSITDPAARAHVAQVWGVDPDELPGPGIPAVALLDALGRPGGPRALLVHGSNPAVSVPGSSGVRERLAALDLLVVCDLVPSETALLADVVLPVTQWAEEEGTMTSLEGRVLRRRAAVRPPAGVRSELWVWAELARRLDAPGTWSSDPAEVFDELARASAGGVADYSGLSHARLDAAEASGADDGGTALHWPCPATPDGTPDHPGTPRLFLDRFPTPDGRARLVPVRHRGPSDDLGPTTPVYLVTGRVLAHYQSGAQTRRVPELVEAAGDPFVEVHPLLAERTGVADGDLVHLDGLRGRVTARVRVDAGTRPDTVFMAFHWAGPGGVNEITSPVVDPVSSMPELKVCTVSLTPAADAPGTADLAGAVR